VAKPLETPKENGLDMHTLNFIEAIRKNDPSSLNCSIQDGAHVASVAQMGNISFRTGQKLNWDNIQHQFTDASVNNKYLINKYHNGYTLPTI